MDIAKQRKCLNVASGCLLMGAIGAAGWSLSGLGTASSVAKTEQQIRVPSVKVQDDGTDQMNVQIGKLSLRRPLFDPPPKKATPAPRPVAPAVRTTRLNLTLVGTIIDEGNSVAIISDSSGKFDIKGVGEALELSPRGVSVQSIDSEQVDLKYQGKTSTVKIDKKNSPAASNAKPSTKKNRRGIR